MPATRNGPPPEAEIGPGAPLRATSWLSRGFELLLERCAKDEREGCDFDVVIVGSGYGGAVAAAELAARFGRVAVLERGREYLPGAFPSRTAELGGHVRFSSADARHASGNREALFDVRLGPDVCALVANGLGGGSLINAGVLEAPAREVWGDSAWPEEIRTDKKFIAGIGSLGGLSLDLGSAVAGAGGLVRNTVLRAEKFGELPKVSVLKKLAGRARPAAEAAVTIGFRAGDHTSAQVALQPCIGCGDCATGCNHGAKNSLDLNLLVQAHRAGAELFTGATVLRLDRGEDGKGWVLVVNHTDAKLRERQRAPLRLRATRVVLAAGTFGSTEILLRSHHAGLQFSPKLGQRFSTNGDMISVLHDTTERAHCSADPDAPNGPPVGPTIAALIDLREGAPAGDGIVIEDLAVPAALRPLFEQTLATAATLHGLARADETTHRTTDSADPCAVDPAKIDRSLLVAMMWRDRAEGRITLSGADAAGYGVDAASNGDGAAHVHWPGLRDAPQLAAAEERLAALGVRAGLSERGGPTGELLSNPIWRLLPPPLEFLLGKERGPVLTVHPLGGCPMGDDALDGVVDHCGRVFDAASGNVHKGLLVLDGAIVPTSLGINPALTIAALARRALAKLAELAEDSTWTGAEPPPPAPPQPVGNERPRFRATPAAPVAAPHPTSVQLVERLCGVLPLRGYGPRFVELTLHFAPVELRKMMNANGPRELALGAAESGSFGKLRVFDLGVVPHYLRRRFGDASGGAYLLSTPEQLERGLEDADADWIATLSGTLRLFHHENSSPLGRRLRAGPAWLLNRGVRDMWQYAVDERLPCRAPTGGGGAPVGERVRNALALASRAGEVRLLEYELKIEQVRGVRLDTSEVERFTGARVHGLKRLTYECRANPWRQLMEMTLDAFPALDAHAAPATLALDLHYLARQGVPLLRIVEQADQPGAMIDLAGFALYVLRMLLNVHVWSFRKPDTAPPRRIERLPGTMPGLPVPQIEEIAVGERDGRAIRLRLTHYAQPDGGGAPVLMIHGYSASGTTFAHPAVRPNLAEFLHRKGRDVWILDMRTSAGMPTARLPWSFEEVARSDIPVAIRHVQRASGAQTIDIVAHCMGAAMLGMALLGERLDGDDDHRAEPHWDQRQNLHEALRHVVMSQVGPAVMFSPTNVLRGFVMRYAQHFLGLEAFQFQTPERPGVADQLLDRLLATLPYPKEEFGIENPLAFWRRTPWTATRHRMDALYGRDFSLVNATPQFLACIDDHFGPLSIATVSQGIHFARFNTVTDRVGYNCFVSPRRLHENFDFPLLSIHGVDNGLVDVATLDHMEHTLKNVLPPGRYHTRAIEGHGHQDCLIGKDAATRVFPLIEEFLKRGTLESGTAPTAQRGDD